MWSKGQQMTGLTGNGCGHFQFVSHLGKYNTINGIEHYKCLCLWVNT